MLPTNIVIEDLLAVEEDVEDDWDSSDIAPSGAIDVWYSFELRIIHYLTEISFLLLGRVRNAVGVFCTALQGLETVCEHCEALVGLAEVQALVQET